MTILTLGIDLAKNVFAVHGVNESGAAQLRQPKVARAKLNALIATLPPCMIGIEACSGAHHWARQFQAHGHTVKLMAPKLVAPALASIRHERQARQERCSRCRRLNLQKQRSRAAPQHALPAMQSVVGAGEHGHETPFEIHAEVASTRAIASVVVRLPDEFGKLLVVSYRPRQAWVAPHASATISF